MLSKGQSGQDLFSCGQKGTGTESVGRRSALAGTVFLLESSVPIWGVRTHHHGGRRMPPKLAVPLCPRKAMGLLSIRIKSSPGWPHSW